MAKLIAPAAWGKDEFDVLTGADLLDKSELIGQPFLITDIQFKSNNRTVNSVWVTAMDVNGEAFQFSDSSSTGIRQQLVDWLTDRKDEGIVDTGEIFSVRLAIMLGLRVSTYDATNERGKTITAKTYYLRMTPEA